MSDSVHVCKHCNQRWVVNVYGVRGEGKTFKTMQMCHNCGNTRINTYQKYEPEKCADYEPYKSETKPKQVKEQKKAPKRSVTEEVAAKRSKWEAVKV
jgi:hypothetical protein